MEQRKLNVFHKLLTMDTLSLSHQLLDYRLNLLILWGTTSQSGLIPDAYVLLNKYNLTHSIDDYRNNAPLPSKYQWKKQSARIHY